MDANYCRVDRNLGPFHTYSFSFENATFSLRIRLPSTRIRWRSMKTELFENAEVTLSIPIHSAPYWKLIQDGDGRFPFLSIDTYASSMRSQVSYRFQIDSSYTCGRTKTMRKCYEWTPIFWKTEKKSCVFKRIRIRMDRALVWMNENGGFRIRRFQTSYRAYPVCDRCYHLSIVLAFS